jgi:hypothetical protein
MSDIIYAFESSKRLLLMIEDDEDDMEYKKDKHIKLLKMKKNV